MPPNIGAVGPLAIFLFLTAATIIVSLIVFSYAAYSFLLTLVNTAAGCDEVDWPGDPLLDWLWMFWYLLWIGAVCTVPAVLALGPIGLPVPLLLACVAVALWMLVPVSLLSSLSASTRWVIYRPKIMGLFFEDFGTSIRFYLLTGLLAAGMGGLLYLGLCGPLPIVLLPVSGAAAATFLLIYARLLGRLGHRISWQRSDKKGQQEPPAEADRVQIYDPWSGPGIPEPKRPEERPAAARPARPRKKKARQRSAAQSVDPWVIPPRPVSPPPPRAIEEPEEEIDDPLGPVRGSYQLMEDDRPWAAAAPPPVADQLGAGGYDLMPLDAANPSPANPELPAKPSAAYGVAPVEASLPQSSLPPENPETIRREEALARRREQPPPPARLLTGGVFNFPFYSTSLQAWITLTAGFFAVIGLVRALIALNPFPGLGY